MEETQIYDFQDPFINMLNDDCLKHIFQFLPIVDKIRIERVCKRWRILSLDSWYKMKKIDTSYLLQGFPKRHGTTEFILKKIEKMLSRYGKFIIELHLPNSVTTLQNPSDVAPFNRKLFEIVMEHCSNLTNINVSMITIDKENKQLFMGKKITRLTLERSYGLDEHETFFQEYPQLNYLQIFFHNDFGGKCLSYLPVQTMRTLIVRCCWNIDDTIFSMGLAKLENLEHLEISCTTIGRKTMETITNYCKKLKILQIYKQDMYPSDAAALRFTNLINLQTLKMTHFPFSLLHFTDIAINCQQITSLDISGGYFLGDNALGAIATLPKLEYLNISFVLGITDFGLKNLKNLKGLECSGCGHITNNGIHKILHFSPQLQLLDLSFCNRITNNIYEAAKIIHDNEPSKMVLKIYVLGTRIVLTDKHKVHPTIQLINECFNEFYIPPCLSGMLAAKHIFLNYYKKQYKSCTNWREQIRKREAILLQYIHLEDVYEMLMISPNIYDSDG
ncbi:F-box/LRR-repeat protein 16-like [Odontomachus brunneus]|uniref:F-box/LRR-repeat protein 16-like n=1 Tax=Odontomachus brunneus TaxID=486640 RepID=UPI0013F1DEC4|nr:F-box/LRR-repeat protein 16-like [Odontomachus brunneus]